MSLENYRADAMRCTRCAYCKWMPFDKMKSWRFSKGCPSIEFAHFHSYSAGGRLVTALSLMDKRSKVTEAVKDSVFKCNLCGSCDVTCKMCRYDMEPILAMRELRAHLVKKGHTLPQIEEVMKGLRKNANMVGKPRKERGDWAKELQVKNLATEKAEVVFHAGCRYSFDGDLGDIARSCVKILKNSGADFGILGAAETCCGFRSRELGYVEDYEDRSASLLKAWKKAGVTTVVTPCSDCYFAFKRLYPEQGSTVKVLHMVEYLDQLLAEGKLKFTKKVNLKVTYHDPCHLGRMGEKYVPWNGKEKKIFGQAVVYDPPPPALQRRVRSIRTSAECPKGHTGCGAGRNGTQPRSRLVLRRGRRRQGSLSRIFDLDRQRTS